MGLLLRTLSLLLATLLAWPCDVRADYFVAIAKQPLTEDDWIWCDHVDTLDDIVSNVDPTTAHQIKVCVGSGGEAAAITNDMLQRWYGSGLSVVFAYEGPPTPAGPVPAEFLDMVARAGGIEERYRKQLHDGVLLAPVQPLRLFNTPTGGRSLHGPAHAFTSVFGLAGMDLVMTPGGTGMGPAAAFVRMINFPPIHPPQVVPLPLPTGQVEGALVELVLKYLYSFDISGRTMFASQGPGATSYQFSPRAFGTRYEIAQWLFALLQMSQHHLQIRLAALTPRPSSSSSSSSSSLPAVPGLHLAQGGGGPVAVGSAWWWPDSLRASPNASSSSSSSSSSAGHITCGCCGGGIHTTYGPHLPPRDPDAGACGH